MHRKTNSGADTLLDNYSVTGWPIDLPCFQDGFTETTEFPRDGVNVSI